MDLSIVVPTIRPRSEIEVIEYLDRCSYEAYEVIIREDYPVTKARNEGYRQANADKILFLDDDSMPRDGYLREASKTLETEDAVAGKTVHPRDDLFAGQLTSHYSFGDEPRYVDRFWGNNMGLRREVLDAVGGWDENMGWGHEEKDLAERVIQDHEIYYNPEMIVDHVYAESLFDYWRKQYKLEQETPYLLRKQGFTRQEITVKTLADLLSPQKYLGRSIPLTLARTGRNIAKAGGRIVGLFDDRLSNIETGTSGIEARPER
jgi:GT2 family glycosyltransferase